MTRLRAQTAFTVQEMLTVIAVMAIIMSFAGPFLYRLQTVTQSAEQRASHDRFIVQASTMFRNSVRPTDPAGWQVAAKQAALGDRACRVDPNGMHFGLGEGRLQPLGIPPGLRCAFSREVDSDGPPRLVLTIHEGARLRARIVACGS